MAGHNIPQFPLTANIWRAGNAVTNPPDVVSPAQIHVTVNTGVITALASSLRNQLQRVIYLPVHTDVRPQWTGASGDNIECPAGSGRYYLAVDVDDHSKGFQNEWRMVAVIPTNAGVGPATLWPMPIP